MGSFGGIWETRDRGTRARLNRKSVHQLTGAEIGALFFDTDLASQYAFAGSGNDSAGSNNLSAVGSPSYGAGGGPDGQFIVLNGSTMYLIAGSSSVHDITTGDFSITGWIYRSSDNGGNNAIVYKKAPGNVAGYGIRINTNDQLEAAHGDGTSGNILANSTTTISTGTWYFFAVVWDRDQNLTIYLNGTQDGTPQVISAQAGSMTNVQTFAVGTGEGGQFFLGKFDDIRMWTRALSTDEVKQIMNDCHGGMTVLCTEIGSGFTKDQVYQRNAENTAWDELAKANAPSLTSPDINTDIELKAQAELRLADADSTHHVGFKAPTTVSANKIWTLPSTDGSNKDVLATNGTGVLSFIPLNGKLLNGDDMQSSQICTGSVVTAKTYTLPANSYTKILVMAYGSWNGVYDAADDPTGFSVDIQVGGVSKKLINLNPPQFTLAQVADNQGDMWWSIMASFVQTSSTDITIKGNHDGTDSKSLAVEGFYVFGMQ